MKSLTEMLSRFVGRSFSEQQKAFVGVKVDCAHGVRAYALPLLRQRVRYDMYCNRRLNQV